MLLATDPGSATDDQLHLNAQPVESLKVLERCRLPGCGGYRAAVASDSAARRDSQSLLIDLLDGEIMSWRHLGGTAAGLLPIAVVGAALVAWQIRRRPTWVRVSCGGIELAANGSDPILLDRSEIVCARVRRRGLRAVPDVVPADPDTVRSTDPAENCYRRATPTTGPRSPSKSGVCTPALQPCEPHSPATPPRQDIVTVRYLLAHRHGHAEILLLRWWGGSPAESESTRCVRPG